MRRLYLDYAATTPTDPRVFEAMLPLLRDPVGNASSTHALGRKARYLVEESREQVAALLGATPSEILFTSGATEANNTALHGVLQRPDQGLVTSAAEHEAILQPAEALQQDGHPVTVLTPAAAGVVTPDQLAEALRPDTALVSLMMVNNETGAVADVQALATVAHTHGALFHTDAVQAAGHFPLDVGALNVDLLSLSGHKLHGPKGVGVLVVRAGTPFRPLVRGGAQERDRRGGTENVAAIVGLAEALRLARAEAEDRRAHLYALRDHLYARLRSTLGESFVLNTPLDTPNAAAPHIVNIAFPPVADQPLDGEMLLLNLDMEGVMASAGSACTSGALSPSHVLQALGLDEATASAAVRFSLGTDTTTDDVDFAVERLGVIVDRMRPTMAPPAHRPPPATAGAPDQAPGG
ncbi:MAG: cysteine desulfurase family protein [Bacteroidota bacterium]